MTLVANITIIVLLEAQILKQSSRSMKISKISRFFVFWGKWGKFYVESDDFDFLLPWYCARRASSAFYHRYTVNCLSYNKKNSYHQEILLNQQRHCILHLIQSILISSRKEHIAQFLYSHERKKLYLTEYIFSLRWSPWIEDIFSPGLINC